MISQHAYWMLVTNALWDFICVAYMLTDIFCGKTSSIAHAHFALWARDEDRASRPTKLLFTCLVLEWGMIRMFAAMQGSKTMALITYGVEGLLVVLCTIAGTMDANLGLSVFFMSAACALVLIQA